MLASAPVLCPDPKEPTRSLSCLPQSEKDLENMYLCQIQRVLLTK